MTLRALNVTALLVLLTATAGAWLLWNAKGERMVAKEPVGAVAGNRTGRVSDSANATGRMERRMEGSVKGSMVASAPVKAFAPGEPPQLLPVRVATAEQPAQAWEQLLATDGSAKEDVAALRELVHGYLHAGLGSSQRTIGFNEDLVAALTDRAALGEGALPANHPAIRDGRLIDRWGTPWQVHPLEKDVVELRSAGPDRKLYTADDLVGR